MNINKLKESYLEVISESKEQDNDLKNYIKGIVEEVLDEAYGEMGNPQSSEAKKVIDV